MRLLRRKRPEPVWPTTAERLTAEIARQETEWGPFTPHRPSVRLGFACLEDELKEALEAYEDDRHDDFCGLGFIHTQEELIQVAAIACRLVEAFNGGSERRARWEATRALGDDQPSKGGGES